MNSNPFQPGDRVRTGGRYLSHEGTVEKIVGKYVVVELDGGGKAPYLIEELRFIEGV